MRGDVPDGGNAFIYRVKFSPHARGCSALSLTPPKNLPVFPACAGMFRRTERHQSLAPAFSPHARGCSAPGFQIRDSASVFPACAGMFPGRINGITMSRCFPRMRGDVPWISLIVRIRAVFSPHARGCSVAACLQPTIMVVFPACAGMFLYSTHGGMQMTGFPRMRGDVPW